MKVILLEKIRKLGNLGEAVSVKSGFARNYLIPRQKALPATAANQEVFEASRAELEAKASTHLSEAEKRAELIKALEGITIEARVSAEGKLYGSVGPLEIVKALEAKGIEVTKQEINLPAGPIKESGDFKVECHLAADVDVTLSVTVQPEAA